MSIQKINEYYKCLVNVKQASGTQKESSIRRCFANLLSFYAEKKTLFFVDEFQIKGTRKIADGGLIDKNRFVFGYWEAKDLGDNLEKEIENKIKIGYPTFNIIFENSETAVLFQNDIREQCDIKNAKAFDKLLNKFIAYESPEARNFREALAQFAKDVPDIILILGNMIQEMLQKKDENQDFVSKRLRFIELCKICINPNIQYSDIDEMIIQHILTEDIFRNIFTNVQFLEENNIAKSLIDIEKTFFVGDFKANIIYKMERYYKVIKLHAQTLESHKEKQNFLKNLYEEFYKAYNPRNADKLGIVYTPSEVVNFMLKTTDSLLEKHFDKNLIDKNVHILDPATGTGTFITDLLDYLPHNNPQKFIHKYKNEIHANEVAILPYYIAYMNIQYTFLSKMQTVMSFDNLCWVDTLDNVEVLKYEGKQNDMFGNLVENTKRIKAQNDQKISVIIGNPPYNAKQQNFNDQNANRLYKDIDKRIKETFVKQGSAQNQIVLYDMYVRFYAWAMDRIDQNGIVAFISNRSFIDGKAFDGFRKIAQKEFEEIYIIDLKGDIRQNNSAQQGGNIFNIMTGVSIAFLIKNENQKNEKAKIFYHNIGDGISGQEKLETLQMLELDKIPFERIRPDAKNNWINLSESNFQELIPLIDKEVKAGKKQEAVFQLFSRGVVTQRDEWVYDFSKENLAKKMKFFVNIYQKTLKKKNFKDKFKIKWDFELTSYANRKIEKQFEIEKIVLSNYRPFTKKCFYFDKHFNGRTYRWADIYEPIENQFIAFSGIAHNKTFQALAFQGICDLGFVETCQCLPLYRYQNGQKIENITDWALELFGARYESVEEGGSRVENTTLNPRISKLDTRISKTDIFHYVYAVLHSPEYRKKYEIDLKRDFPRIPLYADFWKYAEAGKKLMDLHLNYENIDTRTVSSEPQVNRKPLESLLPKRKNEGELANEKLLQKIKPDLKLKVKDGIIEIDELTTISDIPSEVWEYKLGSRIAIEWVLDQYKPYQSGDATIQEQFNTYNFFDYKEEVINLLLKVIFVSVETMKIVRTL
ncbi:MAG: DNA methyltransferase [Bacteroidetes bacterium]|nr:MAG: DNA methyltransferase [Bacteroidota bacterium]